MATPVLGIVVPCYNEQEMLETTIRQLSAVISGLVDKNKVADSSCMILVDDGSRDATWDIISKHAAETSVVCGVKLAGNVGHQNALIAGLTAAVEFCDVTISIDADLQDDINVIEQMVDKYLSGTDIVYGVRDSRATDTFFKKNSALMFYKLMNALGTKTIYNHADYRLMSRRAAEKLLEFGDNQQKEFVLQGYLYKFKKEQEAILSKYRNIALRSSINIALNEVRNKERLTSLDKLIIDEWNNLSSM